MIKYFIYTILFLSVNNVFAQTLIAVSNHPEATANHNQRKIVRDTSNNIYVVFMDTANQKNVIKGVMYDTITQQWSTPTIITEGSNPTISISKNEKIHLVFESNDSISKILYISSTDFLNWTPCIIISDTSLINELPVADIDSSGNLNVLWIQHNNNFTKSLIYACVNGDSLLDRKQITTKNDINDIAIANHLQYYTNDLFFAIQFTQDSLQFLKTTDNMVTFDTIYSAIGSQPCITYNSSYPENYLSESLFRFLFIDQNSQLTEIEADQWNNIYQKQISTDTVDYVCIDDVAPPIGYSFLFKSNGNLYHGFSYGAEWNWSTILDTITNTTLHPSIAYKHFNPGYVDFIWMEDNGNGYNIFYKRDTKYTWVGIKDYEEGKGFSITGYPNPFSEKLSINVSVENQKEIPIIEIYNLKFQLVNTLKVNHSSAKEFSYEWDATNKNGKKVTQGTYFILCSVGKIRTARKVVYIK